MKKTALVLVILLVVALIVPSAHAKMKIGLGGNVGLNISTMVSDAQGFDTNKKSRNGFVLGGVAEFHFSDFISLQPEMRYAMKGLRQEVSDQGFYYKAKYNYDYLEIPVYLKVTIPTGIAFGPHAFAGPVVGIKLSSNYDVSTNIPANQLPQGTLTGDGTIADQNSIDFGLGFGAGGHFDFGAHGISLSFVYNLGLTNVDGSEGAESMQNRCLSIIAGYVYTFNK
ncbi:MAG: porin family protein [bacterium]|nr:porin family protein [bacterium]